MKTKTKIIRTIIWSLLMISLFSTSVFAESEIPYLKNRGELIHYLYTNPTKSQYVKMTETTSKIFEGVYSNIKKGVKIDEKTLNYGEFEGTGKKEYIKNKEVRIGTLYYYADFLEMEEVEFHLEEKLKKYKEKPYKSQWDMICDFMTDTMHEIEYDHEKFNNGTYYSEQDAYSVLDGKSVCAGMSLYTAMALNKLGVPAYYVSRRIYKGNIMKFSHGMVKFYDNETKSWMYLEPTKLYSSNDVSFCKKYTGSADILKSVYNEYPKKGDKVGKCELPAKTERSFLKAHKKLGTYREFRN